MHNVGAGLELGSEVEKGLEHRVIAEQQELDVQMTGKRALGTRNNDRSPMVSPHGVERDADFMGHGVDNTVSADGHNRAADANQPAWPPPRPFSLRAASAANVRATPSPPAGVSNTEPDLRG